MKKTILIDVDETICKSHIFPWASEFLKKIGRPLNKSEEEFTITNMIMHFFPDKQEREKFLDYYLSLDTYKGIQPVEGAIEGVRSSMKFTTYIC